MEGLWRYCSEAHLFPWRPAVTAQTGHSLRSLLVFMRVADSESGFARYVPHWCTLPIPTVCHGADYYFLKEPLLVALSVWTAVFFKEPVNYSSCVSMRLKVWILHYPLLDLLYSLNKGARQFDQIACQAKCSLVTGSSRGAEGTSLNLSAQNSHPRSHLLLPICLTELSCPLWECSVSGTRVFFTPLPLAAFPPAFARSTDYTLHCSSWTLLWRFWARKLGFCSRE